MTTCEWIKCEDRLPEHHEPVLAAVYGLDMVIPREGETVFEAFERQKREIVNVTIAFLGSDGWYGADGFPMMIAPDYWAELPEPPKPEGGE